MFDGASSDFHWFSHWEELRRLLNELSLFQTSCEAAFEQVDSFPGYCAACQVWTQFQLPPSSDGGWRNLRESFICQCGLNGRMRSGFMLLDAALRKRGAERALMFERLSPLYRMISARYPQIAGSEFLGLDRTPGEQVEIAGHIVRHESILSISLHDEMLDLLFHADILEHVPDHVSALRECARVLVPGGLMLFTCPFFDLDANIVRSGLVDGKLIHHAPPIYHSNPLSSDGSLVFTEFGWPLWDDLHRAGFSKIYMGLIYSPLQGIFSNNNPYREGHMWPLYFAAEK